MEKFENTIDLLNLYLGFVIYLWQQRNGTLPCFDFFKKNSSFSFLFLFCSVNHNEKHFKLLTENWVDDGFTYYIQQLPSPISLLVIQLGMRSIQITLLQSVRVKRKDG